MDYELSQPPPSAKCRHVYDTQDVKSVRVNAVCGVQSLENRFGSGARERIYAHLRRHFADDDEDAEVSDDESYVEYFTSSDEDNSETSGANSNDPGNGDGSGHAMDAENDSNENDNPDDDIDPSENGGASSEPLVFHNPVPPVNIQAATPTFSTFFADSAATAHDSPLGDSGENAAQSGTAPSSGLDAKHNTAIPRAARARLYFAAYHSEIHVFRPQPAPEILKGPLLILNPPASAAARKVGGYICKGIAHQVNHLITGDLGGAEILLLAYDDGDVIAYYTRHVVDFLESSSKQQPRGHLAPQTPRPFFHETVGASAWGLAIHSLSRLIAVSCNRTEVDVFAFALQPFTADDSSPQRDMQHNAVPIKEPSPITIASLTLSELERHFRSRDRHWRVLLSPGSSAGNIPCIDFISDKNGFAEKVAAIDIHGSVSLLDIWTIGSRPIRINPPLGNRAVSTAGD
ncbi:hypothetical protein SEPCBS57363_005202 [Sporothrix epigloea]|uniref:Uncharacterized protein n=1 Tax=Sporothrix epigloea TaxID=1892477 RepID=A0ABP0DWB4_9PEZI